MKKILDLRNSSLDTIALQSLGMNGPSHASREATQGTVVVPGPTKPLAKSGSDFLKKNCIEPLNGNFRRCLFILSLTFANCFSSEAILRYTRARNIDGVRKVLDDLINARDPKGNTPLLIALMNKDVDLANLLIDRGADINASDKDGFSPLIYAVLFEFIPLTLKLIEHGADVNQELTTGETALYLNLQIGDINLTRLLLNAGADPIINVKKYPAAPNARIFATTLIDPRYSELIEKSLQGRRI